VKSKQQKRDEADERRLAFKQRDPLEQLRLVHARPGESAKETARLKEQLRAE
jgi:hypothetical protein